MKRFSLKMCSIIMVIALMASFMIIPSSATVAGSSIDFSLKLVKCVDETDSDGEVASDYGNIYKLVLHMNSNTGTNAFAFGLTYDTTRFSLIADDSTGYFSFAEGNSTVDETGYTDVANVRLGCLADTGKYGKDGSTQTTAKNILYYGLGLTNAKTTFMAQAVETDSESHLNYLDDAGYDSATDNATIGVMFVRYMCSNAIAKGVKMATGDEDVWEFYLKLNDGATLDGAEFRISAPDAIIGINANADYSQKLYFGKAITFSGTGATDGSESVAASTTDSFETLTAQNLVYTAPAAPVLSISQFKDQVRYNDDSFDYRTVYKIDNFSEIFADLNDGSNRIIDAGFIFSTEEAIDVDAAKEQVESWKATADGKNITFDVMNYSAATRCYISRTFTGADYAFACLVKDIPNSVGEGENANLSALGYIIYEDAEGNTAYAYYDYTLDVDALYNQYK